VRILSNAIADRLAALPVIDGHRAAAPPLADALAEAVGIVVGWPGRSCRICARSCGRSWAMTRLLAEEPWPVADPALLISDTEPLRSR